MRTDLEGNAVDILLQPTPALKLRREYFGGIALDAETGLSADLDRAAFQILAVVAENGLISRADLLGTLSHLGIDDPEGALEVLDDLVELGFLMRGAGKRCPAEGSTAGIEGTGPDRPLVLPDEDWPALNHLTAPVTVHWAVTYRCDSHCPDCYARRHQRGHGREMNPQKALEAVATLAQWGVLQLAIGGGEPLLRPDLADLASAAAESGMVVHVTTGLADLPEKTVKDLSAAVSVLQLNIDEHRLMQEPDREMQRLGRGLQIAADAGIRSGANLKLGRTALANFGAILERLEECGFDSITLLRYKPPPSPDRWLAENPSPKSLLAFEGLLTDVAAESPGLSIRVDCALSFLFRHLEGQWARNRGIRGCAAAQRIAALDPEGYLLPCSQLAGPRFRAGNIFTEDPGRIWRESEVLRRYRFFREEAAFRRSQCGVCRADAHCGGCRVFARDALGPDPFCPEPLLPPLKQLGRRGREVDLEHYLATGGFISVAKYMQRYGVGQRRAVKELRSCSFLTGADSEAGSGRRKTDLYTTRDRELVASIQDTIGYTSGGVPFATADQIRSWLQKEDPDVRYAGYPLWLLREDAPGEMRGVTEDEDHQCFPGLHR